VRPTANDILFNPDGVLEQAESETDGNEQTGQESQVALATLEQVGDGIREKAETFEQCEGLLRERLAEMSE